MESESNHKKEDASLITDTTNCNKWFSPLPLPPPTPLASYPNLSQSTSSLSSSSSSCFTVDAPTKPSKRYKRQELSFAERIDVIAIHRETGKSLRQLAAQFGCGKTQILNILSQSEKYQREWEEKAADSNPHISKRKRRSRLTGNEETNRLVWQWYSSQKELGVRRITGPMMQREARSIARGLGITNFTASNGWLERFRRVHNIGPRKSKWMGQVSDVNDNEGGINESDRPSTSSSIPIDPLFNLDCSSNSVDQSEDNCIIYGDNQKQQDASIGFDVPVEGAPFSFIPFHLPTVDTRHRKGRHYQQWGNNSSESFLNNHCDLRHLHCDQDLMLIQDDQQQTMTNQYQTVQLKQDNSTFQVFNGKQLHHNIVAECASESIPTSAYLPPSLITLAEARAEEEEEDNRFADQFSLGACIQQQQSSNTNEVTTNSNQRVPFYHYQQQINESIVAIAGNVDCHPPVNDLPTSQQDHFQTVNQSPIVQQQNEEENYGMYPTFPQQCQSTIGNSETAAKAFDETTLESLMAVASSSSLAQTNTPNNELMESTTPALINQNHQENEQHYSMHMDADDQSLMNILAANNAYVRCLDQSHFNSFFGRY